MKNFYDRLVYIRKKRGLTQKNLAEILNISPTCLNYWEKGKTEPNVEMIKKISESLDVSADYLLGLSEEEHRTVPFDKADEIVPDYKNEKFISGFELISWTEEELKNLLNFMDKKNINYTISIKPTEHNKKS